MKTAEQIAAGLTDADIGGMFTVPWSPNPHRLEFIRDKHCQLHGEYIGLEYGFRKRRNSEARPWGSIGVTTDLSAVRVILQEQADAK